MLLRHAVIAIEKVINDGFWLFSDRPHTQKDELDLVIASTFLRRYIKSQGGHKTNLRDFIRKSEGGSWEGKS